MSQFISEINELTGKIKSKPKNATLYRKRAGSYFESDEFDMALDDYDQAIEIHPKMKDYFERGLTHFKMRNYDNAIDDFDKVIGLKSGLWNSFFKFEIPLAYLFRGYCHYKMGDDENSLRDLSSFESELKKNLLYKIFDNGRMIVLFVKKLKKYNSILEKIVIDSSIHFMLKIMEFLFDSSHRRDTLDLARFLDNLNFESDPPKNVQSLISEIFQYYPNFDGSLSKTLRRDGKRWFFINVKSSILEYKYFKFQERFKSRGLPFCVIFVSFILLAYYFLGIAVFVGVIVSLIYSPITFDPQIPIYFNLKKAFQEEKEQEIKQARVHERNKVIADLSHSIKNLVSTIIDPLKNLKKEKEVKPAVIDDALKGANLIREIVNAMNLSFRGSVEDFYHDARNGDKERMDLQSALVESLIYSVGNMFDGKYFPDFQMEYFTSEDILNEAEFQWTQISQSKDLQEMTAFLRKHLFEPDFSFANAADYAMGNEKGSAIKCLILFQELILNAVKYSAFVSREGRRLRIQFSDTPEQIAVRIENRYNEKINVSTSGIGHVIVENFCKLMETEPMVTKENGIYTVDIRFANFWKEEGE